LHLPYFGKLEQLAVTIRSSNYASLPANAVRVTSGDRSNMAIIACSNFNNDPCFQTSGNDADNWRITGLDLRRGWHSTTDLSAVDWLGI
jgi:hypothetical protein